ncbi:MAG: hypothetical protein A2X59_01040 [Nitrospirae bacterium GWC2_42_7]|nr:MAG: hypothetical protein A2X59_01040 [Nitrospirae bacterium GWC2_42_7]
MSKELNAKNNIIQSIICHAREHCAEDIDKAYEYFWDRNHPDEFLSGTALELGFINFEDWLVFDYKVNEARETLMDLHVRDNRCQVEEELEVIKKTRDSLMSLYEVVSVSKDKRVLLKDLLLGGEFDLKDKALTRGLKKGDIFATRLLNLDGKYVMSGCVYPYKASLKKKVMAHIDKEFGKYIKNANPNGTMKDFLKEYGDVFNIFWMNLILSGLKKED